MVIYLYIHMIYVYMYVRYVCVYVYVFVYYNYTRIFQMFDDVGSLSNWFSGGCCFDKFHGCFFVEVVLWAE